MASLSASQLPRQRAQGPVRIPVGGRPRGCWDTQHIYALIHYLGALCLSINGPTFPQFTIATAAHPRFRASLPIPQST